MICAFPLILAALAAAPQSASTVVLVTRRTAVSFADGQAVASQLSRVLREAGIEIALEPDEALRRLNAVGVSDPATCASKLPCVIGLGRQLSVDHVVAISMSELKGERAVYMEAVRVMDAVTLDSESVLYRPKPNLTDAQLTPFSERLKKKMGPSLPAPADVPKVAALAPAAVAAPPVVVVAPRADSRSRIPAYLTGGAAIVGAVVAGVFALSAQTSRGEAQSSVNGLSPHTQPEAQRLVEQANSQYTLSLVAAGATAALGGATVVLW